MAQNMQSTIGIFDSEVPHIALIILYFNIESMIFIINLVNQILEHRRA